MDDDIHILIYSNLMQLSLLHPLSFPIEEGTFKGLNIKGFQNTMHYLLRIIDPVRCAQMKWPVLDKKDEAQFRMTVKIILAETNEKYPEACFPVVFPSLLMKPSGKKFVHLMWCVSKFALLKKLCETYGPSDMLFPLKTLKNDPFFCAKFDLLQLQIESTTQKAITNQTKIDVLYSLEHERELEAQLKDLTDEARSYEKILKEILAASPIGEDTKEKLCDLNHDVADLVAQQGAEWRTVEAIIHVLSKNSLHLSECCETVRFMESNGGSESCIDVEHFNKLCNSTNSVDADLKELMIKVRDGKFSLSSFIDALSRLLPDVTAECLPDVNSVLPTLQNLRCELQGCERSFISTEAKLREKLKEVHNSTAAMYAERRAQKHASEEEPSSSSSSSFQSFLSSAFGTDEGFLKQNNVMDVFVGSATPDRDVVNNIVSKHMESEFSGAPQFDSDLLLTPGMNRENSSPFTTPSICTRPSTARSQSLLKKQLHQQQFKSGSKILQRQSRDIATVSKELFEHSPADTDESEQGSSVSKSTHKWTPERVERRSRVLWSLRDIAEEGGLPRNENASQQNDHSGENDSEDFMFLPLSEQDLSSSPSTLLMCTETPTEAVEPKCKQEQRRKSLEALIERYRRVRQNMSNK